MTTSDVLTAGYRMGGQLVHRMTHDLTPAEFAHQPVSGSNSAAWIVGHLAVTLWRTADRLGAADLAPLPPGLLDRFTQTGKPAGNQSELGDPAALLTLFDSCLSKVIAVVPNILPEKLIEPATRPGFATSYGEGVLFGALHIAMHTGQLSIIRRSLGKPPVV